MYDTISGITGGSKVYIIYNMHARRAYPEYEIIF